MNRLTDAQRRDRAMTGAQLQEAITKTATILGWQWLHIRPGLRSNGRWYVPVEGDVLKFTKA